MGAIDFIKNGAPDHLLKRGLVLAPLDNPEEKIEDAEAPERPPSEAVLQIEKCCMDWRAGRVKPYWVALRIFKPEPSMCNPCLFCASNSSPSRIWLRPAHCIVFTLNASLLG
jgi:hypothetical protein